MDKKLTLDITGMSCTSCAQTIEKALNKKGFIKEANVNFANKKAYIKSTDDTHNKEIIKTIEDAGYKALIHSEKSKNKYEFKVEGMTCNSCAINIEKTLNKVPGVVKANINFADKKAVVSLKDDSVNVSILKKKVQEIGYKLIDIDKAEESELIHLNKEKQRLIIVWIITIPLTIKMIGEMFFNFYIGSHQIAFLIDMVLAFPVIFILGFPVIKATLGAIKNLSFNMDSLIGIGTFAAYSTGILIIFGIEIDNFVVVGAMIMSINFIGNYLKELATGKASQAIKQLLELGSKSAHLIKPDGTEVDISVEELNVGDIVMIRPGEKIPVDGKIVEGETSIDESIATGESIPIDKKSGDKVIGATINQQGAIKVRIEKIGKDTFLSQIIKLVEEAQGTKIPIQEFADKVTSYFVPIVLVITALTFIFWIIFPQTGNQILTYFASYLPWIKLDVNTISMALFASIATLVIACPCALGLATPTALMVGMGKGAANGILIRNGEAIQTSQKISKIVFDKTGTITRGVPVVTDYKSELDKKEFFIIVGSVENMSEHPVAKAIVSRAKEEKITFKKPSNFKSTSGKGINAKIDNKEIIIGSLKYFKEKKINLKDYDQDINEYLMNGRTTILVAKENKLIGILGVSDDIKKDSIEAINKLHNLGIQSVMLTGDNKKAAEAMAKKVGIDEVYSELLPEDKINIIKKMQDEGEIVAMVGDGINDAPSLKQANVGIAIGTGTDIAIESADITLVSGSLTGVYKAIILSRRTFKKIMQNLFWAFFYNIVAIPLAVLGLLHPIIAEIAMAFSSINVVGNSLRLKRINLDA